MKIFHWNGVVPSYYSCQTFYDDCTYFIQRIGQAVKKCFDYIATFVQWLPSHLKENLIHPVSAVLFSSDVPDDPKLFINRNNLKKAPQYGNPEIINYIANETKPLIETYQIIIHFNQVFAAKNNWDYLFTDQDRHYTVGDARNQIQREYLNYIQDNKHGTSVYASLVAGSLEIYLKGIIFALRNTEMPREEKAAVLIDLASAASHCPPRRHEEALKIYRKLSNQMETLEEIILQYIQQAKEDLFLNYYSLSREPVQTLNFIRSVVGKDLGLDTNPVNVQDVHILIHDARSPDNPHFNHNTAKAFKMVFNRIYTPNTIMELMKNALNARINRDNSFTTNVTAFIAQEIIQKAVKAGILTQREQDLLPAPYQNDYNQPNPYHLTDAGVKLLLVHFGILNTNVPNDHLYRVEPRTLRAQEIGEMA